MNPSDPFFCQEEPVIQKGDGKNIKKDDRAASEKMTARGIKKDDKTKE